MASRTIRPGRYPKDLSPLKNKLIEKIGAESRGFKKLFDDPEVHDLARSTHVLTTALRELEEEGLIEKGVISRKNQPYFLTEDAEVIRRTDEFSQYLKEVKTALDSLDRIEGDYDIDEGNQLAIEALLWDSLLTHLKIVQILSNVNPRVESYTRRWFKEHILETMFELTVACSKLLPDTTAAAIAQVQNNIKRVRPTVSKVENKHLQNISRLSQEKIIKFVETPIDTKKRRLNTSK